MTTLEQVKAIIADHAGRPASEIHDDAEFAPASGSATNGTSYLDLDSLDRLELAMACEEHFGIEITDKEVESPELGTVAGLARFIDTKLVERDAKAAGVGVSQGGEHVPLESFYVTGSGADYPDMTPGDMLAAVGTDALKWSSAFMQTACMANPLGRALRAFPHADREPLGEIMLDWFANAIEAGRAAGMAERPLIDETSDEGRSITWRKKPVEIQAVCYRGVEGTLIEFNQQAIPLWLGEALAGPADTAGSIWLDFGTEDTPRPPNLTIGTLEGNHVASPGDWIVRGVKNELYPVKPDIFAATYDAVTD